MNPNQVFSYSTNQPFPHHPPHPPMVVSPVDPYVVETLKSVIGKYVVLETTRGRIDGCVVDCKPDHVILDVYGKKFFVRICEIVWIMPG
ncbi:YuzF family protein [Paenibacillus sp. 1-18]|uniref:YuzF family protein n=1 Tax=Paenibacillus sp. 1-18 TaxID=1333846 RepID=UPI0004721865|nr:YuzF family protein [Paenibacillus sp. 1-18]